MKNNLKKNNKKNKIIISIILVLILVLVGILIYKNLTSNEDTMVEPSETTNTEENKEETPTAKGKVDIIDINSKTRPYAVAINNTPVAVKVQEGLNDAYLVYEIPTEGNTSRLLALYKDADESLVLGTIRSARHNFVDFALESDSILCCFGWSVYAEQDMQAGSIDYLQGLFGGPFYRNNPENLATEHTAYTSISKLNDAVESKGMRSTSSDSVLLNYNVEDTDLSLAEETKKVNTVTIPYGYAQETEFKYDEKTKMYTRYDNGSKTVDYKTKEAITTKNIIVQKIGYEMCSDNYYWDLHTIGTGEGYYITNGYAVPIKWSKSNRSSKTKYTYKEGTIIDGKDVGGQEISVSDGRTWIEVQNTSQELIID